MRITCLPADLDPWLDLGFHVDEQTTGRATLIDDQASYDQDNWPKDKLWTGFQSGTNGYSGSFEYACDGKELHSLEVGEHGGAVLGYEYETGELRPAEIEHLKQFVAIRNRVESILDADPAIQAIELARLSQGLSITIAP